jgi:hypothetical protein
MRADNGDIPPDQQVLLHDLQVLLEKQIELANQGNIKDVEVIAGQVGSLVGRITGRGILEKPEFQNQRRQLQRLYEDLRLAIATQRAETAEEISRVRRVKKTIATYRNNI